MATIGITIPETVWSARSELFYTQVLQGLEDTAVPLGHTVLSHVAGSRSAELDVLRRWAGRGMVDVVILRDLQEEDPLPQQVQELGLPFVVIGDAHQEQHSSVTVDNSGRMLRVLEELHGRGHRAIGHVGGPAHLIHSHLRREAYQEFARQHDLPLLSAEGDYGPDSGAAATRALLEGARLEEALLEGARGDDAGPDGAATTVAEAPTGAGRPTSAAAATLTGRPTAIVYDNDAMAIAGAEQISAAGLRIPEDISIVAWDDSPACQTHAPPMAVLDHRPHQLGIDLARTALALLEDPTTPVRLAHEVPRLLPRGTLADHPTHPATR